MRGACESPRAMSRAVHPMVLASQQNSMCLGAFMSHTEQLMMFAMDCRYNRPYMPRALAQQALIALCATLDACQAARRETPAQGPNSNAALVQNCPMYQVVVEQMCAALPTLMLLASGNLQAAAAKAQELADGQQQQQQQQQQHEHQQQEAACAHWGHPDSDKHTSVAPTPVWTALHLAALLVRVATGALKMVSEAVWDAPGVSAHALRQSATSAAQMLQSMVQTLDSSRHGLHFPSCGYACCKLVEPADVILRLSHKPSTLC